MIDAHTPVGYVPRGPWRTQLDLGYSVSGVSARCVIQWCWYTDLVVVDVNVESSPLTLVQRVGEYLVGFAANAMLGVLV